MFISRDVLRRVKNLEEEVARMKQEKSCQQGIHKWVMVDSCNPYIRCSECRATPKKEGGA